MEYETICNVLKGSEFEGCVFVDNGVIWLRYDTDDSDPKEQWDNFVEVQEGLRRFGLQLDEALVEHDCISGNLIFFMEDNEMTQRNAGPGI